MQFQLFLLLQGPQFQRFPDDIWAALTAIKPVQKKLVELNDEGGILSHSGRAATSHNLCWQVFDALALTVSCALFQMRAATVVGSVINSSPERKSRMGGILNTTAVCEAVSGNWARAKQLPYLHTRKCSLLGCVDLKRVGIMSYSA